MKQRNVRMALFNFKLTPIAAVAPWGSDNDLRLSWFGLTDGCYWLCVGEDELFRVTPQYPDLNGIEPLYPPYVDYYLARLWEDVIEILPEILVPVDPMLAEKCAVTNNTVWKAHAYSWIENRDDAQSYEIYDQASSWYHNRCLYTSYLKHGPQIWFWSDGIQMNIGWDNRDKQENGIPVWEAQIGSWSLPVADFLEEILAFDRALMENMQTRVDHALTSWDRTDVHIHKDQLVREHTEHTGWLHKILDQALQKPSQDWTTVLDAISLIT